MEISSNSLAAQEININRAQVGQDILQKTVEKTEESRQSGQSPERPATDRVSPIGQSRIDTYA